ncbi:MAG TPA: hypothetical protein VFQ60_05345 [Patescibacteria group bacterium]|nr:hypothetical protein [Patescibacteria group bacterium]
MNPAPFCVKPSALADARLWLLDSQPAAERRREGMSTLIDPRVTKLLKAIEDKKITGRHLDAILRDPDTVLGREWWKRQFLARIPLGHEWDFSTLSLAGGTFLVGGTTSDPECAYVRHGEKIYPLLKGSRVKNVVFIGEKPAGILEKDGREYAFFGKKWLFPARAVSEPTDADGQPLFLICKDDGTVRNRVYRGDDEVVDDENLTDQAVWHKGALAYVRAVRTPTGSWVRSQLVWNQSIIDEAETIDHLTSDGRDLCYVRGEGDEQEVKYGVHRYSIPFTRKQISIMGDLTLRDGSVLYEVITRSMDLIRGNIHVVHNQTAHGPFGSVSDFSIVNGEVAFIACLRQSNMPIIVHGDRTFVLERDDEFQMQDLQRADGKWLFRLTLEEPNAREVVVHGLDEGPLWSQVFSLHVKDDKIIHGARKGDKIFLVSRPVAAPRSTNEIMEENE